MGYPSISGNKPTFQTQEHSGYYIKSLFVASCCPVPARLQPPGQRFILTQREEQTPPASLPSPRGLLHAYPGLSTPGSWPTRTDEPRTNTRSTEPGTEEVDRVPA